MPSAEFVSEASPFSTRRSSKISVRCVVMNTVLLASNAGHGCLVLQASTGYAKIAVLKISLSIDRMHV